MGRPNIFKYAQKELSQDAMICWLLECYHSENAEYRQIGLDFIRFIFDNENLTFNDVELEKDSPHRQYYRMDVYANIRIGDKIIPVIFEDKTNTYLHGNQYKKYIDKVTAWENNDEWKTNLFNKDGLIWGNIMFVFFKTGYIFNWQRAELNKLEQSLKEEGIVFKVIDLEKITRFIRGQKNNDELIFDYCSYLENKREELKNCRESVCDRIFSSIFTPDREFYCSYQGWAEKYFMTVCCKDSKNDIHYAVRMSRWRNREAIVLYQYKNKKDISESNKDSFTAERRKNAVLAREICKEIYDKLNIDVETRIEENDKNSIPNQNNIFKVFIDDNEEEVCRFYKRFIEKFTEKMSAEATLQRTCEAFL